MAAPEVNVWVDGSWYGPSYPDAGERPGWRSVTNSSGQPEQVLSPQQSTALAPPPKAGPGSSRAKWAAYAEQSGVKVPDGADRDAIIAACQAADVPTE